MLINPIASGSSGNAYYISDGQSSLLLDAGIPLAQIQAGCGYKVSQLSGCLVTHGHGDHVKAAKALARMGVNIYTSQGTADMASLTGHRICTVRALESFRAGTFEVLPFDVEHDVPEPLGFLIRSTVTGEKVLYFTDTVYIKYTFIGLTHIMMEANYDPETMEQIFMIKENFIYVGIDLHKETHTAVMIDCYNQKLGEITFPNRPADFPKLVTKVKKCNTDGKEVVYGLENAYGYGRALAVWLIDKGYLVKDVNTAISHRQAKHRGAMYRKSDSDDVEAIALATLNMLDKLPNA